MDELQREMDRVNKGSNNNEEVNAPYKHLEHESLYFNKDNPSHTVRILPPANGQFFAKEFREIFLKARNKNGKDVKVVPVVGSNQTPENSEFLRNLVEWQQKGLLPDNYGGQQKLASRYFVNAVNIVVDQTGSPVMERDQYGNLVVRLLKLPTSAYQQILSKLADPMLNPGEEEYGFIGVNNAYPVKITRPAPGGMTYGVDVYSNKPLGPLPQGWENSVEDLEYQATPTEEYDHTYLPYLIDILNGNEDNRTNQSGASDVQGSQTATAPPTQSFNQAPQQSQQQQQSYQAPTQQQQSNAQWAPQQNTPQAPQQNFNQAPQQAYQAPQQQQQFYQAPTQQPQAPQQSTPPPAPAPSAPQPQGNAGNGSTQSVDDVLSKLQQGFNN